MFASQQRPLTTSSNNIAMSIYNLPRQRSTHGMLSMTQSSASFTSPVEKNPFSQHTANDAKRKQPPPSLYGSPSLHWER